MDSVRSRPVWLPAAVASVTMLVVLILLGFVGQVGSSLDSGSGLTPGAVVGAVVLLVIGFLGTWWAVRGIAPGSSPLPVFLSIWMILLIGTALAVLVPFAMNHGGMNGLDGGALSGARWGWIAALLATLTWARPGEGSVAEVEEPQPRARGEAGVVPEGGYVMKRASDFPELTLDRRGTGAGPDADAEPAPNPEPHSHPDPEPHPDPDPEPHPDPEPDPDPDPAPEPPVSAPDEAPPARSGGSHRRES